MVADGVVGEEEEEEVEEEEEEEKGMHPTGQKKPEKMHEHLVGIGTHLKRKQVFEKSGYKKKCFATEGK